MVSKILFYILIIIILLVSYMPLNQNRNEVISDQSLSISTYDGRNQTVHPSIYYNASEWNQHKYWMAYTPYPFSNDNYENPSIAVSDDGYIWSEPEGIVNPIVPIPEDVKKGGHLSDVDLVMIDNILECWYRRCPAKKDASGPNNNINMIYRTKSEDGITWSKPEKILDTSIKGSPYQYCSPAIIYEDSKYKMWFSSIKGTTCNLYYMESTDKGNTWSSPILCNLTTSIWHQDICKTNLGYEMFYCSSSSSEDNKLFYSKSIDGINWETSKLIATPLNIDSNKDINMLYRPSFIKIHGFYKVYISARLKTNKWYIYLTEGYCPTKLKGYSYP